MVPTQSVSLTRREFVAGAASLVLPAPVQALDTAAPLSSLDEFIAAEMSRANIVGLAAGFAKDGEVRFTRGYGFADLEQRRPVTGDTMFHLASVTKLVTAAAVMRLVEEQRFGLDDPIAPYLDFAVSNPAHAAVPITFRHLLMHVSSISDVKYYEVDVRTRGADSPMAVEEFLRAFLAPGGRYYSAAECFSKAAPGTAWDYSNIGYGLLGHLISRIGRETLVEQTRRNFFTPLGMQHTSWTIRDSAEQLRATPYELVEGVPTAVEPVGFPDAGTGMLRASITDFMRFIAACANGGSMRDRRILQAGTLSQMFAMKTPPQLPAWLTGQGLGWMEAKLEGVPTANHWGGDPGVFTAVYAEPATRRGLAIFTNSGATTESKAALKNIASRIFQSEPVSALAAL